MGAVMILFAFSMSLVINSIEKVVSAQDKHEISDFESGGGE